MAELEAKSFNPYHKWLGIRDAQSPPNHYRLLGLELWESDEEVIREAASRQSNHVRSFRGGPQGKLCHKVLEELNEARETLLDLQAKKNYDRTLRKSLGNADAAIGNSSSEEPTSGTRTSAILATSSPIECRQCGAANAAARQFCGGCGIQLWEPCIECESLCGPGDLHCGSCGVNVAVAIQRRSDELQNVLRQAELLRGKFEYSAAIQLLEPIVELEHPKLAKLVQVAEQTLRRAMLELNQTRQKAETAYLNAQKLFSSGEFESAAQCLEGLPPSFISDAMHSLLAEIRTRQAEASNLSAEIRRCLAEQAIDGLLEKVERLVAMQPCNDDAQQLLARLRPLEENRIDKLRNEIVRRAVAAAKEFRYSQSVELLEKLPEAHRNEEIAKLLKQVGSRASEVAWLAADLRDAAMYDDHLLPIARRLLKLQPNNSAAENFCALLERRTQKPTANDKAVPVAWPSPPATCVWGFPLVPFQAFQRIKIGNLQSAEFLSDPARFSVAAGLALQALQRATIAVSLTVAEKTGVLSLLKSRKRAPTSAWGIDPGRGAVKAVKLSIEPDTGELVVVSAQLVECDSSTPQAGKWNSDAPAALEPFLERADLKNAAVAVGISGGKVFTRFFSIPLIAKNKLGELMHYEVKQQIPFPLETLNWGYHLFDPADAAIDPEAASESSIALLGLKSEDALVHLKPFEDRGIKVDVLQSDSVALFNFFAHETFPLKPLAGRHEGRIAVQAIVEIGAEKTNLVLTNGRTCWTRCIPLGGNEFTRSLQREFAIDSNKAEQLKRNPTAAASLCRVYEPLKSCFEKLAYEVHHSIDQYLTQDSRLMMQRMHVAGGGLKLHGLFKFLQLGR